MLKINSAEANNFAMRYIDKDTGGKVSFSEEALEYLLRDIRLAQILFEIAEEVKNNPYGSWFTWFIIDGINKNCLCKYGLSADSVKRAILILSHLRYLLVDNPLNPQRFWLFTQRFEYEKPYLNLLLSSTPPIYDSEIYL